MADDVRHRHASAGLAGVGYGVKAALAVAIGGLLAATSWEDWSFTTRQAGDFR